MKINSIEITNYKAFLGTHAFRVGGKNLFIYGENGSGKSKMYHALKDFFQASPFEKIVREHCAAKKKKVVLELKHKKVTSAIQAIKTLKAELEK